MPSQETLLVLVATVAACSSGADDDDPSVIPIDGSDMVEIDAGAAADIDAAGRAGERCKDAEPIVFEGGVGAKRIFATTELYDHDYDIAPCVVNAASLGPDRVYLVNVAAGKRLIATVKPIADGFDPSIYLVGGPEEACAAKPLACLAASDDGHDGDYDRVMYRNTGTTAVDVRVIVDGPQAAGGTFRLDVQVDAIPPTPPGDTCALAEPVTLTNGVATLSGTTSLLTGYDDHYAPHCTAADEHGNDHVYAVTIPAGERLEATLTPMFSAALYVLGGPAATCGTTCLAGDDGLPGQPAIVRYENTTGVPTEVFLVVDSYRALTGGAFTLSIGTGVSP